MLSDVLFRLRLYLRVFKDTFFPAKCRHPEWALEPHTRLIEEVLDYYETCTLCGVDLYD